MPDRIPDGEVHVAMPSKTQPNTKTGQNHKISTDKDPHQQIHRGTHRSADAMSFGNYDVNCYTCAALPTDSLAGTSPSSDTTGDILYKASDCWNAE